VTFDLINIGYIARYQDIEDLIQGIQLFLNDNQLSQQASFLARQRVLEYFTEEKMHKNYISLYQEILDKR
jgi:glycosyltransferase involved in cell wall biosynthesis